MEGSGAVELGQEGPEVGVVEGHGTDFFGVAGAEGDDEPVPGLFPLPGEAGEASEVIGNEPFVGEPGDGGFEHLKGERGAVELM